MAIEGPMRHFIDPRGKHRRRKLADDQVYVGGFERYSQIKVLKWKMVRGKLVFKARLTVRGFKDGQIADVQTFAATAKSWGQRLLNVMAATLNGLSSPQAFLGGLTLEQVEQMEGEITREVQFTVAPGSVPVLR